MKPESLYNIDSILNMTSQEFCLAFIIGGGGMDGQREERRG